MQHAHTFLDQTQEGRNGFFSWLLGFVFLIGLYFLGVVILVSVETFTAVIAGVDDAADTLLDGATFGGHFTLLSSFLPFIGALWIVQKKWHKRAWRLVITGARRFRWKLLFVSGALYFGMLILFTGTEWLFSAPGEIKWVFDPNTYWVFLGINLLLVPFQAASEEMLFRGYMGQWFARFMKNKWLVYVITSLLFASLHFYNPEAESDRALYLSMIFTFGFVACVLTHVTNGLEAAMGVHIFNNLFVFSGVSHDLPDMAASYLLSFGEFSLDVGDVIFGVSFEIAAALIILRVCRSLYQPQASLQGEPVIATGVAE